MPDFAFEGGYAEPQPKDMYSSQDLKTLQKPNNMGVQKPKEPQPEDLYSPKDLKTLQKPQNMGQ